MFKLKQKVVKNRLPHVKGAMRAAVAKVVNETADEVVSIAVQLAPYDPNHRSPEPHLRDTIHTENYADNSMAKNVVVDSSYGAAVEMGTHNSAAQPFLRPAAESVKQRRDERLRQIETEFEKEVG